MSTPAAWDPDRYLTYADERGRPFVELVGRIDADAPRTVVDLGCGPGNLTALLRQRWPGADVLGVDSSPEMVAKARTADDGVRYEVGDLAAWTPPDPVDVLVSNAALQPLVSSVDAWETTYLHVLHGEDPVLTWISGTSARPVLAALPEDLRPGFVAELRRRLAQAYPDDGHGVVMPFRRIFVVART